MTPEQIVEKEKELQGREKAVTERETIVDEMADHRCKNSKMVRPIPSNTKMVKVRSIRPFRYTERNGTRKVATVGMVVNMADYEAKEIVEHVTEGNYDFSGERHEADGDIKKQQMRRGEYVDEIPQAQQNAVQ